MISPESRTLEWIDSLRTQIGDYLERYAAEYGFTGVTEFSRQSRTLVPKTHASYQLGINEVRHYTSCDDAALATALIDVPTLN